MRKRPRKRTPKAESEHLQRGREMAKWLRGLHPDWPTGKIANVVDDMLFGDERVKSLIEAYKRIQKKKP